MHVVSYENSLSWAFSLVHGGTADVGFRSPGVEIAVDFHPHELAGALGTVPRRMRDDLDPIADLEDLWRDPRCDHHGGAGAFKPPAVRLPVGARHVNRDPHVRKSPLDVRDHALDGNQLAHVEHRPRMMG